jgi:hypothetical protein
VTRWFLADLKTGRQLLDLPVLAGSWSTTLNEPETLSVTVDMQDPDVRALNLRANARVTRTVLAVAEGEVILAAGIVWSRSYDRDAQTAKLNAKGLWSYFDHRYVLPVIALTIGLDRFIVPDPADDSKTIPNPALTTLTPNVSAGTTAKRLVQQARAWTGGNLPIVFQPDEAGAINEAYIGPEFPNLGEELDRWTKREDGVDIDFRARLTVDKLGIEWVMMTGTVAQPLIFSAEKIHQWNITVPESPTSSLSITEDGSDIASLAWQTGGRSEDTVLVARAYETSILTDGGPLLETLDSSHTSVKEQSTLQSYANEDVLFGRTSFEVWEFDARADQEPFVGSYWKGDWVDLVIGELDPETGLGDAWLPQGGTYRHRIVGLSGDHLGETVHVQCAPEVTV